MNPQDDLIDDLQLLEPPEPFQMNWWFLVAGVAALWLVILIVRMRRSSKVIRLQAAKIRRAWVDALEELEKLFALIDREESRDYAVESSAIIRHYIEDRFELSASRQSTEEFLETAQHSPKLEPRHQASLSEFLRICDLLKFARTLADKQELRNLHDAAVAFVTETRPQKQEVQPA